MSISICDQTGTQAHVLLGRISETQENDDRSTTYQLASPVFQVVPFFIGLPDMTISQRRIVLATTGMSPTDRIIASAARRLLAPHDKKGGTTYYAVSC